MKKFIVITTINKKTEAIRQFEKMNEWQIVIVGDRKSEKIKNSEKIKVLSLDEQKSLGFLLCEHLPYNHYCRKNIGYLYALQSGADIIYDTDDDNFPYPEWDLPDFSCNLSVQSKSKFANIYSYFTDQRIWPRGYPIDLVKENDKFQVKKIESASIGVWQGLADEDADVDAIYRLLFDQPIKFKNRNPISLAEGVYCPFNSQNTFWQKKIAPLLFLPSWVSFRFTDIFRSFVAQRLMWEQSLYLGFTGATVYQVRNSHDYMKDFRDEVECYLNVHPLVDTLESCHLSGDLVADLVSIYETLTIKGLVDPEELQLLRAWCKDLETVWEG